MGLLLDCGFFPGPHVACLCAAVINAHPSQTALWQMNVSLQGANTTFALPANLSRRAAQQLHDTFSEVCEGDYQDRRDCIKGLFTI